MGRERELNECRRRYARGIVFMYRNRLTQNKLMFVFSARNFHEMYRRIRYAQEYTRYQRAQGLAIAEREAVIRGKREQLSSTCNSDSWRPILRWSVARSWRMPFPTRC